MIGSLDFTIMIQRYVLILRAVQAVQAVQAAKEIWVCICNAEGKFNA
jgi:hypothetical protein